MVVEDWRSKLGSDIDILGTKSKPVNLWSFGYSIVGRGISLKSAYTTVAPNGVFIHGRRYFFYFFTCGLGKVPLAHYTF